ncbi:MAG: tetratricopeptide repeat protein [Burkholderiaceae bacterium]|nr:tetratricopeptide repeat protein [Burkholderiaceae bacterium]
MRALECHHQGRLLDAKILCVDILVEQPAHADALALLGVIACQEQDFARAAAFLAKAIQADPKNAAFHLNYGTALQGLRQLEAAVQSFGRAINLAPGVAEFHFNRGNALKQLGRLHAAVADYNEAIALKPSLGDARWSKAFVLLLAGDFENGLPLYEWRPARNGAPSQREYGKPVWTGREPLAGKTILLHAEQGLGDTIMFCRYASLVADMGARVLLEVQPELVGLLEPLRAAAGVYARGMQLPAFDFHCALPSLPLAFGTTVASIPASPSYLESTGDKRRAWAATLGEKTRPRIGVVWSSTSQFEEDILRSLALSDFVRVLPDSGMDIVCLQKELKPGDRAALAARPDIRFVGDAIADFTDTAALIDCVDLVVSTCTSVPHLAGAMGKPTWILQPFTPDWRWLLGRDDSPWYPSVKLYRQPKVDDWQSVFARVRADLEPLADGR